MSKRNKIIIAIIIVLVILLGLLYWFLSSRITTSTDESLPNTQGQEQVTSTEDVVIDKPAGDFVDASSQVQQNPTITPQEVTNQQQQASVKAIALSFIERMGSFSNQSDYANIEELKPFMTEKMNAWAESYLKEQRSKDTDVSEYYGITTKVISLDFQEFEFTDGTAYIEANTQRIEYTGAQRTNRVRYQVASISLIKKGDVWFVDEFSWL